ncbi:MAG: guanylate kinase [Anaerolineae bacterium]|nr:guanylate kinase [Anaerolineae bacterium]
MVNDGSTLSLQASVAFGALEPYLHPSPVLIVISGPSGVGKDSVIVRMREQNYPFHFVVTATDRAPRQGEVHGIDYYFVTTAEFEDMIAKDELFEHALVYGQHKGVPKAHARRALQSGTDVIMRLDVQGAATIKQLLPTSRSIFLVPPSMDTLEDRLRRRRTDSEEQVQKRIRTALAEMQRMDEFDYVVVNHEGGLDQTIDKIVAIITAEKCRFGRQAIRI